MARSTKSKVLAKAQTDKVLLVQNVDIYAGHMTAGDIVKRQRVPENAKDAIRHARGWQGENFFVESAIKANLSFYDFGAALVPREATKANIKKLDVWLDGAKAEDEGARSAVNELRRSIWNELVLVDNVVALWRNYNAPAWRGTAQANLGVQPAYLMAPESCDFTDKMGMQVLKVQLDVSTQELKERGFGEAAVTRYGTGQLVQMDPLKWGEFFRVLRRQSNGFKSFCRPRLHAEFKTLRQSESMEVAEQALAMGGRTVIRQWMLGWEPKITGLTQSNKKIYLYNSVRAKAIEDKMKSIPGGLTDLVTQFDQKVQWGNLVDPKFYDGRKWDTIVQRLVWWAGPAAFMYLSKSVSPFLLQMLEAQAKAERELVGPFVEELINRSFKPPVPVKLVWSSECFRDARLAWDMVKTLQAQGPLSSTTALKHAGVNPEGEIENKRKEAKSKEDYMPLVPPGGAKGTPGRQTQVPDNSAVA